MPISGNIYSNVAPDILGGVERGLRMSDMVQQRQQARQEQERQTKMQGILQQGTVVGPRGEVSFAPETMSQLAGVAKPQELMQLSQQIQQQKQMQADQAYKVLQQGAAILNAVIDKPEMYSSARTQIIKLGVSENDLPETYDKGKLQSIISQSQSLSDQYARQYKEKELGFKEQELALKKQEIGAKKSEGASKLATDLRKERSSLPTTKESNVVAASYNKIKAMANDATGASDMSLIFSYMKMLDPNSTVREGEYASAKNTAGIPQKILNEYNRAKDGQFLSPKQREDFANQAEKAFKVQMDAQKKIDEKYSALAKKSGVDPKDVIFDIENKPKKIMQNGHEYILNEETGEYE